MTSYSTDVVDLRDKPVRTLGELSAWCAEVRTPRILVTEEQRRAIGILDVRVVDVAGECKLTDRETALVSLLEVKP